MMLVKVHLLARQFLFVCDTYAAAFVMYIAKLQFIRKTSTVVHKPESYVLIEGFIPRAVYQGNLELI